MKSFSLTAAKALAAITSATLIAAGCSASGTPESGAPIAPDNAGTVPLLKTPAVIAYDDYQETLLYWPEDPHGGTNARTISRSLGLASVRAMVADGHVVTMANYSPAELVSYDLHTKRMTTLNDPYGGPFDVAVDKQHSLYALNQTSVAVYPNGSGSPYQLTCGYINNGVAIAVDDEGDVFVNGNGPNNFLGVVEYPSGSSTCTPLNLKKPERGYAAGLFVDPATDDLIVEDNPQLCAGGREGRITVYSRPYGSTIVARHNLRANCPGGIRLDASSTHLLFHDTLPERLKTRNVAQSCRASNGCVDQRSYPSAGARATYTGGEPEAVTTIPNRLPN